jgi:hypothetical protein
VQGERRGDLIAVALPSGPGSKEANPETACGNGRHCSLAKSVTLAHLFRVDSFILMPDSLSGPPAFSCVKKQ